MTLPMMVIVLLGGKAWGGREAMKTGTDSRTALRCYVKEGPSFSEGLVVVS